MTSLERYRKAYSTLAGRVDTLISSLERVEKNFVVEGAAIAYTVRALTNALIEAEEIFLADSPGIPDGEK